MYFRKSLFILLLFNILGNALLAQAFKTIGYLPYYRFSLIDQIALEKLTHLNIAFANPDMQGNLGVAGKDIRSIVDAAKEAQVQVFISLAGGALTAEWANAWKHLMQTQNRSAFIHKIIAYAKKYDLDGIDMDLEWTHVDELYSPFLLELKDSLVQHNLQLSAALPGTYRYPEISVQALAAYDFINMMVYDLTGSWNPEDAGPHSPYSFASTAITYWQAQGVPVEKLNLGLPFYGYDFADKQAIKAFTYRSMVEKNPANAFKNQVDLAFYNGIPTIKKKTALALEENLGGVMIWELGQDAFDQYSLLNAIDEAINPTVAIHTVNISALKAYPNPTRDAITVENSTANEKLVWITSILGRKVCSPEIIRAQSVKALNIEKLPTGIFILNWKHNLEQGYLKFVKK